MAQLEDPVTREFVHAEIAGVRTEIAEVRTEIAEVRTEITELRGETRTEFAKVRGEVQTESARVRGEIHALDARWERRLGEMQRWLVGSVFASAGLVGVIAGMVAAIVQLFG